MRRVARPSVEIRPFESADIDVLYSWLPEALPGIARAQIIGSRAWTGLVDGKPVAAAGVMTQWQGYGKAWFTAGNPAKREDVPLKVWLRLTQLIKDGIAGAMSALDRLEIYVDARDEKAIRWAERLGFRKECLARKYLPDGADAWIYVIISED